MLPRFQPGCIAATTAIALPGVGDGLGETATATVMTADGRRAGADGLETGRDGLGDGLAVGPLQVTPFRVNDVGAVLVFVQVPLKPTETFAPLAMAAFQLRFAAETCAPEVVTVAPQA